MPKSMKKCVQPFLASVFVVALLLVQVSPASAAGFKDVPTTHWANKEISYLISHSVIKGYQDKTFRPNHQVTNAQVAIMMARALKLNLNGRPNPGFKDIPTTYHAYKEIAAVVEQGIFPKGSYFYPDSPISRESMARALANGFKLGGQHHMNFLDVQPNYWAYTYVTKVAANKITTGYVDSTFRPKERVTRAQFSAFMARALNPHYRQQTTVTRNVAWGMNKQWVKSVENGYSKFIGETADLLIFQTRKFDINVYIGYLFENGGVSGILVDYAPEDTRYYGDEEKQQIFDGLVEFTSLELGLPINYLEDYEEYAALWEKDHYQVAAAVRDDDEYNTNASVLYFNDETNLYQAKKVEQTSFKNVRNHYEAAEERNADISSTRKQTQLLRLLEQ
ncbi:S-layer homology domain-containing protein [Metabacillus iocasae]|uniref:SLH domain-containing protein n=1 Tax=Priestia iocasae TaxID=2291674 RepID=A0ABS2QVR1_9BACI|nr:S-layer homology domain-containing protein [Metabacillus iocasae]MBM7703573.1 hypothetical protein [Metabacillus iocasae]